MDVEEFMMIRFFFKRNVPGEMMMEESKRRRSISQIVIHTRQISDDTAQSTESPFHTIPLDQTSS